MDFEEESSDPINIYYVKKIGISEVDRIFQGSKFQPQPDLSAEIVVPIIKNTEEDRISLLPNDILQFIISFLSTRQAVATSILAKRWRNLRTTCLNLDYSNVMGYDYSPGIFSDKPQEKWVHRFSNGRHYKVKRKGFLDKSKAKFISRVNKFLQHSSASRVDAFRVSFVLDNKPSSDLDRWVKYAVDQGTTELELHFSHRFWSMPFKFREAYTFPFWIFDQKPVSCLKYLSLGYCIFKLPPDFKRFSSLVSMTLDHIWLTEVDVQSMLSNCSSLETLTLKMCRFKYGSNLKFSDPSLVLKHICCWGCLGIKNIEVHDINVLTLEVSFQSDLEFSKLSINNTPNLVRLVLESYSPVTIISGIPPHLETLFLLSPKFCQKMFKPSSSVLNNLIELAVLVEDKIDLLEMIYLLEACPLLQKLTLDMTKSIETNNSLENIRTRPTVFNNNLKEVEIYGFEGIPTKIEFVKYLLKNAIGLEMMKISEKWMLRYHGNGSWRLCEMEKHAEAGLPLKKVCKMIHGKVRSSTKLIIDPISD